MIGTQERRLGRERPNLMPNILRYTLESFSSEQAQAVLDYFDESPHAVAEMTGVLTKGHAALMAPSQKAASLLKVPIPKTAAERRELFFRIARAEKGRRTVIYRDRQQDGTLSVKIDCWLPDEVIDRLKKLADRWQIFSVTTKTRYRRAETLRFYFEPEERSQDETRKRHSSSNIEMGV